MHASPFVAVLFIAAIFSSRQAAAQQVTKPAVPGAMNFAKLETTVACGGATTPEAVPELKKMGFASIINLRLPSEPGANVEGEAAAAKTAGINFYNIPFSGQSPDPKVADQFLATVTDKKNEPAYIHCAAGNRAGAMWMIKRLVVDHWDTDKAFTEATALGLTSPALKQFAIDYAQTHKR
ncbi:MAG TPA: sulfur transferase domain-containing protein [Vicinamibacterales bacterium]|nr:sulfur transferase domain-containing protein [Vicinamibacterales bacterium]